jgi:hypothetical protein
METYDGPAWRLISTLREVASKGPLDVLIKLQCRQGRAQMRGGVGGSEGMCMLQAVVVW